jgi:hypothetical protein
VLVSSKFQEYGLAQCTEELPVKMGRASGLVHGSIAPGRCALK